MAERRRLALVTGAGGMIGSAIAAALEEDGWEVLKTDLHRKGGCLSHDVTSEKDWQRLAAAVEERGGVLGALVNNAGAASPPLSSAPSSVSEEEIGRLMAVNFSGAVTGCRVMLPFLARSGHGAIVNNASLAALTATPFDTAYGASKAALTQYTKSLALEVAKCEPYAVRCNSIHPGIIKSPMTDALFGAMAEQGGGTPEAAGEAMRSRIPLGMIGIPKQVAGVVAFLVSDAASYVTGQAIVIDGGMTLQ